MRLPSIRKRQIRIITMVMGSLVVVLLVLSILLRVVFSSQNGIKGQSIWVTIPQGAGSATIASLLVQHRVIGSSFWFRTYLFLSGDGGKIQSGYYKFASGMSIEQVVAELMVGAAQFDTVVVTIPEGFTVSQIADRLAALGVTTRAAFLEQVQQGIFSYWFMPLGNYAKKGVRYRLEGYLFPDTYDFLLGENPHEVVNAMLQATDQILTPSLIDRMHQEHLTINQLLTIASMIEREAAISRDRPLIASVIYNRLKIGMKLQIDSTVSYALHGKLNLTLQDLAVNSPYNTYQNTGLPVGPIANPGLASIEAALHPAHTDYYYYVAKYNGSGGHYFATTYAQQLANEAKSQANLASSSHQSKQNTKQTG